VIAFSLFVHPSIGSKSLESLAESAFHAGFLTVEMHRNLSKPVVFLVCDRKNREDGMSFRWEEEIIAKAPSSAPSIVCERFLKSGVCGNPMTGTVGGQSHTTNIIA
jgi:hypothetical protein